MKTLLLSLLLSTTCFAQTFQTLKVGDSSPLNGSATLEVKSTTGALLVPRMTTTQKNAIPSPTNGDIVYDTTLQAFSGYANGIWSGLGGGFTGLTTNGVLYATSSTAAASTAYGLTGYLFVGQGSSSAPIFEAIPTWNQNTTGNANTATTATNATNGTTASTSTNSTFYPLFAGTTTNGNQAFNLNSGFKYNPATNTLTTSTFSGALAGNSSTASALASSPSGCTTNEYASSIAANGNLGCAQVAYSQLSGTPNATSTPTASTISEWDTNANMSGNNLIAGYATTATAGSSTTLTVSSAAQQYFTGTSNQTVVLPVASTLANGMQWTISNLSTGGVTINSSGGNNLAVLPADFQATVTVINTSGGTGTASWNWNIVPVQSGGSNSNANYAQAYFASGATPLVWSNSNTGSYTDFAVYTGTPSLTVRQHSGITVTAASSSLPGITFTPASSSAIYYISVSTIIATSATTNYLGLQLTDGSVIIATSSPGNGGNAAADAAAFTMGGIYAPGTSSSVTVKLQGQVNTGAGYVGAQTTFGNAMEWTIIQINPPVTTNGATFGAGLTVTGNTFLGQAVGNTVSVGFTGSTGIHQINGGLKVTTNAQSGSTYTLDTSTTDFIVSSNDSGSAPTYTLPAVSNGRLVAIKDTAGNAATEKITISPASGLIDGLSSLVMAGPYSAALLYSDGTNWFNLSQGETVSARYHGYTSGGVGVSGSFSNVLYTTKDWDSSAAYSSGVYTCPDTGHYRITAALYPTAATITAATAYNFQVVLAGSAYAAREEWFATAATKPINPQVTTLFLCTSGQTVTVQGSYASSETTPSVTASNIYNFIEIWKEGK